MPSKGQTVLVVLSALLLPSLLFLTTPLSILAAAEADLQFSQEDLYPFLVAFVVSSAVLATLLLLSKRRHLILAILATVSVNLVAWNLLIENFWLTNMGSLLLLFAAEVAVFALVGWIAYRLSSELVLRAMAIFAVANIGLTVSENSDSVLHLDASAAAPTHAVESSKTAQVFSRGNVYHIVLDAFTPSYLDPMGGPIPLNGVDGFTFYPQAVSGYGRTSMSMRSVFTGSYHWQDFAAWTKHAFKDGFPADLAQAGVVLDYYPFYEYFCHPDATTCDSTVQLFSRTQNDFAGAYLLDVSFLRALPISARNALMGSLTVPQRPTDTWEYGFSLTSWLDRENTNMRNRPIQSFTMITLRDFLEQEKNLSAHGRYVFLHMILPHGPFVFDPECRYVGKREREDGYGPFEDQSRCAVKVIGQIGQHLRELDRFDDSLIIIHSDHGIGNSWACPYWWPRFEKEPQWPGINRSKINSDEIPSEQIRCVSNVLMLIKRPGQKQFSVSDAPIQLIDVAPTILDYFGLSTDRFEGISVLNGDPASDRKQLFFESNTSQIYDVDHLSRYVREGDRWNFRERLSITPAVR